MMEGFGARSKWRCGEPWARGMIEGWRVLGGVERAEMRWEAGWLREK